MGGVSTQLVTNRVLNIGQKKNAPKRRKVRRFNGPPSSLPPPNIKKSKVKTWKISVGLVEAASVSGRSDTLEQSCKS